MVVQLLLFNVLIQVGCIRDLSGNCFGKILYTFNLPGIFRGCRCPLNGVLSDLPSDSEVRIHYPEQRKL